jgi:hypothetical protein
MTTATVGRHAAPVPNEPERRHWSRRLLLIFVIIGALFAGAVGYAASNWIVGLGSGSSGTAESATIANITVTAIASPGPSNLLYSGGTGDVVVTIANSNPVPVTITAVDLPANTANADGYTTAALSTLQTGCAASTPSGVTWNHATSSSGSSHTLTTPLVVGASGDPNNPLTVTFINAAAMSTSSPTACESTFFSMPSLADIEATVGGTTVTTSPITDDWSS